MKTKDKEEKKNLKQQERNYTLLIGEKTIWMTVGFSPETLGAKEVAQYFSCAEGKELSTHNPIFRKNNLQDRREKSRQSQM